MAGHSVTAPPPPIGSEGAALNQIDKAILRPFASKYVWWKTPDEAIAFPERVIAQVMNIFVL